MDAISYKQYLILLIITLFIISCSDDSDPVRQETRGWSVQKIYTAANAATEKGSYSRAIKLYQILQYTYPYGIYNQQSLLELAYTYYQDDQPELALPILDQFINTYPTNANVDYALYLKGYINYKNDNGLLSNFTGQDLSERDPTIIFTSYTAFQKLLAEYPHSKFAPDARDKINRLINALSRAEIYKARYYMTIKAYLAANEAHPPQREQRGIYMSVF